MGLGRLLGAATLLLGVFAPGTRAIAEQKAAATDVSFTLPFEFVDNRILVDTKIGARTVVMVLDTGADGVALTDVQARALGLAQSNRHLERGTGGARFNYSEARLPSFLLGPAKFAGAQVGIVPAADFTNVFGTKTPGGILGKPVFERFVVAIDYEHRQLTFTPPGDYAKPAGTTSLPFELPAQIPLIQATLDGVTGTFGIDTGARSSLLIYGPFSRDHKLREKYDARFEGVTGWGLGGPIRSLLVRASTFSFAGFDIHRPVVRLSLQSSGLTTSTGMAGLIGPDVLARFTIAFDYPSRTIYLEENANFAIADSYDRAGVWMGQAGSDFIAVDVIRNGPADDAGIQAGDRIVAIDSVPTSRLVLPDVRERIRRKAVGSHVKLEVRRAGRRLVMDVALRDLV